VKNIRPVQFCFSFFCLFVLFFLMTGCEDERQENPSGKEMEYQHNIVLANSTRQTLKQLSRYRIVFAHHSVGANILDGLREISMESGAIFSILPVEKLTSRPAPGFFHFSPGKNQLPKSKIDGFANFFRTAERDIDVAFMKFCFVDITPKTNIKDLFSYYKATMEKLSRENPDIRFVHCTVPLTVYSQLVKDRLKRLIGLQVWGDASNAARGKFNELLTATYPAEDIFDLARIESSRQDGSRAIFKSKTGKIYAMASEYSKDGGHLNELGKKVIASAMAEFIVKKALSSCAVKLENKDN
jgi:hypothetical protein